MYRNLKDVSKRENITFRWDPLFFAISLTLNDDLDDKHPAYILTDSPCLRTKNKGRNDD